MREIIIIIVVLFAYNLSFAQENIDLSGVIVKDSTTNYLEIKRANYKDSLYAYQDSITNLENEIIFREFLSSCNYSTYEIDEFTNNQVIKTKDYYLYDFDKRRDFTLVVFFKRVGKYKYVYIYTDRDIGCNSKYDNTGAKIKLENGVIVELLHVGDVDCGSFQMVANLTDDNIKKLKSSKIKTIRLTGSDYYRDYKDIPWNTIFIDKLDCIK